MHSTSMQASSQRNEQQRRTRLIFAEQIEIFQLKTWLDIIKAKNAKLIGLDKKKKKQCKLPV